MAATYNASHAAIGELAADIHRAQVVEATGKEDVAPIGYVEPGVKVDTASDDEAFRMPTEEEMKTLRRVPERVPWTAFWIAMCELSERFSYYGTVQVFQNFIQQPLPAGSTTGSSPNGQAGALGRGQTAATGLTTLNTFWVYTTPLIGAYLADTYWGRFKTINIAVWIAIVGHIILIISAIPSVIDNSDASLGIFSVAIIIMGIGTGFFKSTVSPLIAEQVAGQRMSVQRLPSGEDVIVDPALTAGRIFNWFYAAINIGAVLGQVSMVYAEKYVGFWLSFLLPTIVFLLNVPILLLGRKKYIRTPPSGSVLGQSMRVLRECLRGQWSWNPITFMQRVSGPNFWEQAKPSRRAEGTVGPNGQVNGPMPAWMQRFDDAWVDEVSKGFKACYVFLLFPFYWISYNQISNNLISQAANLKKNNVPNEIVSNLDPISIVILVPLFDLVIYPALRRAGINFTPLKRITAGFITVALGMVWAAVTQHYIYKRSACGNMPSAQACLDATNGETDISVWTQVGAYVFVGLSEVFASVVGLEYAFTKAPKSMRSLVMSVFLFTNAIGSALNQAFLPLTVDPLQVALYGVLAGLSCAAGLLFFATTRGIDRDEDKMNNLAAGHITAKGILAEPQDAALEHHKDLGATEKH